MYYIFGKLEWPHCIQIENKIDRQQIGSNRNKFYKAKYFDNAILHYKKLQDRQIDRQWMDIQIESKIDRQQIGSNRNKFYKAKYFDNAILHYKKVKIGRQIESKIDRK